MPMMDPNREILRMQMVSKAVLSPEEKELYELSQLAGVSMDPEVFKILLDLLKMNVPPVAIVQTLKSMCTHRHPSDHSSYSQHSLASAEATHINSSRRGRSASENTPHQRSTAGTGDRKTHSQNLASSSDQVSLRRFGGEMRNRPTSEDIEHFSSLYPNDRGVYSSSSAQQNIQAIGSRSHSGLVSESTYSGSGGIEPRIRDKEGRGQNASVDSFASPRQRDVHVTTRQRGISSDLTSSSFDSDRNRKKRSSFQN